MSHKRKPVMFTFSQDDIKDADAYAHFKKITAKMDRKIKQTTKKKPFVVRCPTFIRKKTPYPKLNN